MEQVDDTLRKRLEEHNSHGYSNYFEKLLTTKEKGTEKNSPENKNVVFQLKDFKCLIKLYESLH